MIGKDQIESRFGFHRATIEGDNATAPDHALVRKLYKRFAERLDELVPDGRTKDLAFEDLELASMWTHKAISERAPLVEERE